MALTKISTAMWNSVPHHDTHDFNVDDVLYVDVSANRVGIGTTSPTVKLEINPSSGDADLILSSNGTQTLRLDQNSIRTTTTNNLTLFTNGNSNQLMLHSGGNVGIGVSPVRKLDVDSGTSSDIVRFGNDSGSMTFGQTTSLTSLDLATSNAYRIRQGASTPFYINTSGNVGIGTTNPSATLDVEGSAHIGPSGYQSYFTNSVGNNSAIITSSTGNMELRGTSTDYYHLFLKQGGNVGIGTNNPTNGKLQIDSTTNQISIETGTAGNGRLHIGHFSNGTFIGTYGDDGGVADVIRFGTHSGDERMRITSGGTIEIPNQNAINEIQFTGSQYTNIYSQSTAGFDIGTNSVSGTSYLRLLTEGVERMRINSSGNVTANVDMRAPIFYDSDNTGYYGNFADRSIINSLQLGNASSDTTNLKLDVQGNMAIRGTNGLYYGVTTNNYGSWTTRMYANGSTQYFNAQQFIFDNQGYGSTTFATINANGIYAPIFYDSNDTSYYINPNGGSNVKANFTIQDNGSSSPLLDIQADDAGPWAIRLYRDDLGTGPQVYASNANEWYFNHTVAAGTTIRANGDARAPIFYDSDNTGYYVNPQSFSNLGSIKLNEVISSSDVGDARIGRNYAYNTLELKGYGAEMMIGAGNTALHINYRYCNNTANTSQTPQDWYWKAGTSTTYSNHYWGNGYGLSSLRAPIFYDHDNTSYYVDPNGTSNINYLNGNGKQIFNTTDTYLRINQSNAFSNGIWLGSSNILQGSDKYIAAGSNGGTTTSRVYIYGGTYNGSNIIKIDGSNGRIETVADSMRAPIFYDSDNTAYYMNYYGGGALRGNFEFAANTTSTSYQYASIELRESNFTANGTATPPFISFHWGGVVASSIAIESSGRIAIRNNPGTGYENFIAATISATGDVIAYSSSDERLKDNQKNIDNALEKVESLNGIEFDWNNKQDTFTGHDVGVIAQEVEKVLPEIVNTRDTGYKAVKYEKLVPLLIEAIKELSEKVKILENK